MKPYIIFLFVIVSIALAVILISSHQPRLKNIQSTLDLEVYLDQLVKSNNPPGISVAVMKNHDLVYSYATGFADGPNNILMEPEMVYHWWSMTKVVTAIAVMQLSEQGLIDLDAPATDYLPYFQVDYDEYHGPEITIRQLLRHTSGLPDSIPAMIGWVHFEDEVYDQVDQLIKYMPEYNRLRYSPDSKSAYSNYGYMVLGAVIAEVSGGSYENYVREHILKPAGMTDTDFLYSPEVGQNEAMGSHPILSMYTPLLPFLLDFGEVVRERSGSIFWFNRLYLDVTPSSGLIGPAEDAARLMMAYQTPDVLLPAELLETMLPVGSGPTNRPLGWAEYAMGDRNWIQHSGGGPGFATVMRIYPDEDLGIVVMANGTNLNRNELVEAISNLSFDGGIQ